jgi:DNA-binding PadR family transcriptional regulator
MIELAILGLLDDDELHGYELRKRLTELLGTRLSISFGSLYPALNRLERAGLVKAVTTISPDAVPAAPTSGSLTGELAAFRAQSRPGEAPAGSPAGASSATGSSATGSGKRGSSGRAKKVYGITEGGRDRLRALLVDPDVSDERDFAVRVAFCHHLTPTERLDLFTGRRAELVRRRDQRRSAARSTGRVNTYLRSLLERDTESISADLAWLDRLIDAERSAPVDPTPVDPTSSARRPTGGDDRPAPSVTDDTGGPR